MQAASPLQMTSPPFHPVAHLEQRVQGALRGVDADGQRAQDAGDRDAVSGAADVDVGLERMQHQRMGRLALGDVIRLLLWLGVGYTRGGQGEEVGTNWYVGLACCGCDMKG